MPPQTIVYDAAAQAKQGKGLRGLFKSQAGSSRRWIGHFPHGQTVRALGDTGSTTRRSARRPVWE
jgi:hypothetical protein